MFPQLRKQKKKRIPDFRPEDKERQFWATRGSTGHIDSGAATRRQIW